MIPCEKCIVNCICKQPCYILSDYLDNNKTIKRILLHFQERANSQILPHNHKLSENRNELYTSMHYETTDLMRLVGGNE